MLHERDRAAASKEAAGKQSSRTPDDELAVAARHDPRAFEELYLRYADRLYRFAAARNGSTALAEEIVADTMATAFEQLERYDPDLGSFGAWLFTIARRRIVDEQRRLARLWRALSRRGAEADSVDDVLSAVVRSERAANLRAALNRLPERDREVLLLRYVAELSAPEIAEMLGLSSGAVRTRIHRALQRLSDELGDDDVAG